MTPRSPWETLVANALMGTDRQPPDLPTGTGPLGQLLTQLPTDAEGTLLQAAGTMACYQQAGQCPGRHSAPLSLPSDADTIAYCSERTHQHLQTILSGQYQAVLPELLTLLAQAPQRIPAETLPTLLELGRGHTDWRPYIQAVLGERGRWLAGQNSVWAYAVGQTLPEMETGEIDLEAVENLWKTSDRALRLDLLKTLRNRDPDAARQILNTTWKQEKAKDRATFLAILQLRLSLADQPFLEAALQDRAQEVRICAGTLLAHLPESQYCQRMAARVPTYVSCTGNAVTIHLPTPDDTWKNEGLRPQPGNLGKRASLLMQLVAAVPLEAWQKPPQPLIQSVQTHEHGLAILQGWRLAAQRQADPIWARAIIEYWLTQSETQAVSQVTSIFNLLPLNEVENWLQQWLDRFSAQPVLWREAIHCLAELGPAPSQELSQSIVDRLQRAVSLQLTDAKNAYQFRSFLTKVAYYLHPNITDNLMADVHTLDIDQFTTYQQDSLITWQNILQFRQGMWAEFQV